MFYQNKLPKIKTSVLFYVIIIFLLFPSCKKEKEQTSFYSEKVNIVIQNYSVREPIAIRLTDGCWKTIDLNASVSFNEVTPNDFSQLIAFSEFQCPASYDRIKNGEAQGWVLVGPNTYSECINDYAARPCIDSLITFKFSSKRLVDNKNDVVTIKILAEEVGGRSALPESSDESTGRIKFTVIN